MIIFNTPIAIIAATERDVFIFARSSISCVIAPQMCIRDRKYTDYDVHMSDYDAACDYQYCGKWNDTFAEKSGGRLIWKQL